MTNTRRPRTKFRLQSLKSRHLPSSPSPQLCVCVCIGGGGSRAAELEAGTLTQVDVSEGPTPDLPAQAVLIPHTELHGSRSLWGEADTRGSAELAKPQEPGEQHSPSHCPGRRPGPAGLRRASRCGQWLRPAEQGQAEGGIGDKAREQVLGGPHSGTLQLEPLRGQASHEPRP